ncbi:MAG: outer membrane beta-barrel protein [Ferruginibacter sp.]|nr:outer membrane beta-barrel protein [Ferruginibacter sp.]
MKQLLLLIILFTAYTALHAQSKKFGDIKGMVIDSLSKQPLTNATVSLFNKEDSTGEGFAVADKLGAFELKNITQGTYILGISFAGYRQVVKNIEVTATQLSFDLGTVYLNTDTGMLAGVVVMSSPIIINKDTVEFRAAAFKTKPNATVEDLLKKLPGVEVDKDGNISAQGEPITKVYVDGKEFFSNDPKLATKNLTADLIESIQVFDDMGDQARFTKIDDGTKQRTINIKLKKDKRKGYFGRATVGAGSSDRYSSNVAVNSYNNKRLASVLGGVNNVNRLGFSSNDIISNMGGMGGISGGGGGGGGGNRGGGGGGNRGGNGLTGTPNGNTKSWNVGVNYRDVLSPKVEFSGNYFATNTNTIVRSNSYRQNIFPGDSVSYSNEESFNMNKSLNHRFNTRFEYTIDSMNSILLTPTFSVQHSESLSYDSVMTRAVGSVTDYKAIGGNSQRSNIRDGWNLGNNLLFRHRFQKTGRTFTIGWNTNLSESDGDGLNTSPYTFYNKDGSINRVQNRQQRNDQATNSFNNTISTSFTELIDSNKIIELNYAYSNNQSESDRRTYDYNAVTDKFDSVNKPQTNYFENGFSSSRIGTNFRLKKEKYDFQLGGAIQLASLENMSHRALTGKDSTMRQRYTNFFPTASFNYNIRSRKSLRFNYRGSTRAPSITQLQDVLDVSNQLNYRSGNPDLQQEFNNNFTFSYNTFNVSNFVYLNTNISAGTTSNRIVNSIDYFKSADSSRSILLTKPVNVDGSYNISFSGTIGIPLKKVASGKRSPMNLNLTTSMRYNRDVSILYKQTYFSYTTLVNQRLNFNYNIQNKLDVGASANFTYNEAIYTVNQQQNFKYFSHNYSLDITYTIFKKINLSSDFDYYINSGRSSGFNQSIPLWNASAAMFLFKKKNAEVRLSVYDIMNQNKNISRNIGENYFEDTYTQVLRRFFMLSFMYNLNRFGGKRTPGEGNQRSMQQPAREGMGGGRGEGRGNRNF